MHYTPITPDALFLLGENHLRNSREFYEAHKPEIQRLAVDPLRALAEILGDFLHAHDDKVSVVPHRAVSRVHRDTRFTHDKSLYRDHLWLTVGRGKNAWPFHPLFWFEINPGRHGAGVGYWHQPPAFMQHIRAWLVAHADEFIPAYNKAKRAGFRLSGDEYKKPRAVEDCPPALCPFMQKKEFYFLRERNDYAPLAAPDFPETLLRDFKKLLPLYDCLVQIGDDYIAQHPEAVDFMQARR
jgi:uncharacterized protein (TIGR02453 family)